MIAQAPEQICKAVDLGFYRILRAYILYGGIIGVVVLLEVPIIVSALLNGKMSTIFDAVYLKLQLLAVTISIILAAFLALVAAALVWGSIKLGCSQRMLPLVAFCVSGAISAPIAYLHLMVASMEDPDNLDRIMLPSTLAYCMIFGMALAGALVTQRLINSDK